MDSAAPRPRLCHLHKSPDFSGYGFNLHAEKGKAGQYIGKVDPGSPAEKAGLREGDRIVEVNGTNVGSENHSQVVGRIKAVPDEVTFLVVDLETDEYFREHKIVVTGDLESVERIGVEEALPSSSPEPESVSTDHIEIAPPKLVDDSKEDHDDSKKDITTNSDEAETQVALAVLEAAVDTEEQVEPVTATFTLSAASADDDDESEEAPAEHDEHHPRLCELKTWPDFGGFGFNLHANKGEPAQFIGKVDPGSPAEHSGLQEGDRIIEVNGTNVEDSSHQDVVRLVKSTPGAVTLLVVDPDVDRHYKNLGVTVTSTLSSVERITCPDNNPATSASLNQAPEDVAVLAVASPPSYTEATEPDAVVVTSHPYRARLCVINSWKDGRGYGFSMQAQKGSDKTGQFIGKVDKDTPADAAGLRQGDRIIEVNGSNVEKASHKEVVEKIKSVPDSVTLLVVDEEADKYFNGKDIKVSSEKTDCFDRKESPKTKPTDAAQSTEAVPTSAPVAAAVVKPAATENRISSASEGKPADAPSSPTIINGIVFAASAQEARQRMSKKKSVIDDKRSMKDKYELFQQL